MGGDADEVATVEDSVHPGDAKVAAILVSPWTRCQRLSVDLPRVLDQRTGLCLASQTHRGSLGDRVLAGTHGEVEAAVLTKYRYHCANTSIERYAIPINYRPSKRS